MSNFTAQELKILRSLNTPCKVQDFIDRLKINFDKGQDTCQSPWQVLKSRKAHCIEAAMLAALALRLQGQPPLVIDLEAAAHDDDHVVAVFKQFGRWGAISKSNHAVLRYREPIYKDIHELVMSYFHEYTDKQGRKTLRSYAGPINLSRFDKQEWMTDIKDVWYIAEYLANIKHRKIVSRRQIRNLRRADAIERKIGSVVQWPK